MDWLIALVQDLGPLGIIGAIVFILLVIGTIKSLCSKKGDKESSKNKSKDNSDANSSK